MRRASVIGPLLLILMGAWFLVSSLRPDLPLLEVAARYWPLLLIGWGFLRLVEILLWAARSKPLPQAGLSGGEWTLIVLICLVGSGLYLANRSRPWHRMGVITSKRVEMFGQTYDFVLAEQRKTLGKTPRIVLENLYGDVRISGVDGDELQVSGRKTLRALESGDAERADRQSVVEISTQGEQTVVRTNQDRVTGEQRITTNLEITVPRGASLEARARSGEFEVSDLGGGLEITSDRSRVRLRNIGGGVRLNLRRSDGVTAQEVKGGVEVTGDRGADVDLQDIGGPVTVNGSFHGSLQFRNIAQAVRFQSERTDLRVEKVPGHLYTDLRELRGRNLVGPVRLSTRSRDIQLEEFTEAVEIAVDHGDISLRPAQKALAKIEARTRRGRIEVALPESARFQLRGSTAQGELNNDFGAALKAEDEGRGGRIVSLVAQGPEVVLSTERGSITVRKDTGTPLESAPKPLKLEAEAEGGRVRVEKY
ncbi:MAG: hypothetical protein FJW34_04995 [Acidobacteria bacterium]|nr:hypothetical protein [Acidobacteriota bacterium]